MPTDQSYREIRLTQNQVALVDECDFEYLNSFRWLAHKAFKTFYAIRWDRTGETDKYVSMHREILKDCTAPMIDHRNRNGLDNRRMNLRPCTAQQNQRNRGIFKSNTSGIKGVSWDASRNKWRACIHVDSRLKRLGSYRTKEEAALAYQYAATHYFGEFAGF